MLQSPPHPRSPPLDSLKLATEKYKAQKKVLLEKRWSSTQCYIYKNPTHK